MRHYLQHLDWIASQQQEMVALLEAWASINSGTENLEGLNCMLVAIEDEFSQLGGVMQATPLPPRIKIDAKGQAVEEANGNAFLITKHSEAPIRILLGGHMDTVYPVDSAFQSVTHLDMNTMRGPGVADMKGGLVILLKVLQALERSPFAGKIGWEVLITPDEEVGSQGSESLWIDCAQRCQLALLFEPAFSDGSLVSARKGSANFTVVAKGKAAHAGRDFHSGRNAISAIVRFIVEAEKLINKEKGITVNIGHIEGGGPINIVPDLAICRFNVRIMHAEDMEIVRERLYQIIAKGHEYEGLSLVLYENASRLPKPFDAAHQKLFQSMQMCAADLNIVLQERPSGGVCDGNILASYGVPTLDTMGVIGGNIHTSDEYVLLNSLTERASLAASFLMKIANGEIELKKVKELK